MRLLLKSPSPWPTSRPAQRRTEPAGFRARRWRPPPRESDEYRNRAGDCEPGKAKGATAKRRAGADRAGRERGWAGDLPLAHLLRDRVGHTDSIFGYPGHGRDA
jgi:hypothetical protein